MSRGGNWFASGPSSSLLPVVAKLKRPPENLTERRFRARWAKTKGQERERFEQVLTLRELARRRSPWVKVD
jgi:hypothetical protein